MNSRRRSVGAIALSSLLAVTGCATSAGNSDPDVEPLSELLTATEAGGEGDTDVALGQATFCGPDEWMDFLLAPPSLEPQEFVSYTLESADASSVVLGVIPHKEYRNDVIEHLTERLDKDCQEQPPESKGTHFDYEIDEVSALGEEVVAFRAVQWQAVSRYGEQAPETVPEKPVEADDLMISSTARAYGVVADQLVVVQLNGSSVTPPSEQALRELWDAQVAKIEEAE